LRKIKGKDLEDWGKPIAQVFSRFLLALLNNYLKGAAYGSGGAYGFAVDAPVTFFCFHKSDNVVDQYQATAVDTET
jgi:hypothetical protein